MYLGYFDVLLTGMVCSVKIQGDSNCDQSIIKIQGVHDVLLTGMMFFCVCLFVGLFQGVEIYVSFPI